MTAPCTFCGGKGWTWEADVHGDATREPCDKCGAFMALRAAQAPIPVRPSLPYNGTAGWSGSDTSRQRAEREAKDGTVTQRQSQVLRALANVGEYGATWKDLGDAFGWHHGQASGVLSVLHKDGRIARLGNSRNRCAVYVLPQFVMGRETRPHKANVKKACPNCGCAVA